jgi:hypothetical protein
MQAKRGTTCDCSSFDSPMSCDGAGASGKLGLVGCGAALRTTTEDGATNPATKSRI